VFITKQTVLIYLNTIQAYFNSIDYPKIYASYSGFYLGDTDPCHNKNCCNVIKIVIVLRGAIDFYFLFLSMLPLF